MDIKDCINLGEKTSGNLLTIWQCFISPMFSIRYTVSVQDFKMSSIKSWAGFHDFIWLQINLFCLYVVRSSNTKVYLKISAPLLMRVFTTAAWPCRAAICRAVFFSLSMISTLEPVMYIHHMNNNSLPQSNVTTNHDESASPSSNRSHVWQSCVVPCDHLCPVTDNQECTVKSLNNGYLGTS